MESLSNKFTNVEHAKKLLTDTSFIPVLPLVIAADIITRGSCFLWEIETLLEELDDEKCLPDDKATDRLLAGIAMLKYPKFLWDAQAFMTLAQTFNGSISVPELWEPLSPAKVAFSLEEINSLYDYYKNVANLAPLFSEEPKIYMAACCANSGFSELPKHLLAICKAQFDRMFDLKADPTTQLNNSVQARMHKEVEAYLSLMTKLRNSQLSKLK